MGDLRPKAVLLVGHRLSSDRRTAFDWALGMFDTTRCYQRFSSAPSPSPASLPIQSISLRAEVHACMVLIGEGTLPFLPSVSGFASTDETRIC